MSFLRYYDNYIDCDWCGAVTKGRVYEGRTDVSCGCCDRQLLELSQSELELLKAKNDSTPEDSKRSSSFN